MEPVIRRLTRDDYPALSAFLSAAVYNSHPMDWTALSDWLEKVPFLVYEEQSSIKAL